MKIRILSDLHMEGFKFQYEYAGEDVIVLAGDIHTRNSHHKFIATLPKDIPILMVSGNHEHYHGCFQDVHNYLSKLNHEFNNFHYLNNSHINIGNISFFGGTMFTDLGLYGEAERFYVEQDVQKGISDFHHISVLDETTERQWTISDHKAQYEIFNARFDVWRRYVKETNPRIDELVCISHFLPSEQLISPKYAHSMLNPYFACNNEKRVQDVDVWLCGHTHDSHDIMIGETRVVCNPKGYGSENEGNRHSTRSSNTLLYGFDPNLIIEI